MKTTKKIVSALLCAAILLMGAVTPAGSCERGGESERQGTRLLSGIVFKIPVSYKIKQRPEAPRDTRSINPDESDYTTGKLSFLMAYYHPC